MSTVSRILLILNTLHLVFTTASVSSLSYLWLVLTLRSSNTMRHRSLSHPHSKAQATSSYSSNRKHTTPRLSNARV